MKEKENEKRIRERKRRENIRERERVHIILNVCNSLPIVLHGSCTCQSGCELHLLLLPLNARGVASIEISLSLSLSLSLTPPHTPSLPLLTCLWACNLAIDKDGIDHVLPCCSCPVMVGAEHDEL